MHSSWMSTACSSSQVPGGDPLGADTPQNRHPPEQTPPRSRPPHTRHLPGSRSSPDQAPPGADTPRTRHPPPVNRMTNRCKNITLPQTSFAGGKNLLSHWLLLSINETLGFLYITLKAKEKAKIIFSLSFVTL